jgi:hypothetical protein
MVQTTKHIIKTQADKTKAIKVIESLVIEKPMQVTISEYRMTRSIAQNRLMHQWFNLIAEHWHSSTGESFTPMAFKELLKRKFLGFDLVDLPDSQKLAQTKRTRDCNTKELTEFLEKVEAWAATEINCQLPHPDDYYYLAMGYKKNE